MMIAKWCYLVVLPAVLSLSSAAQSGGPVLVKLTAKHNGKEVPTPDRITLNFDNHVLQIPFYNGRFKVPPEVFALKEVTFSAVVNGNRIQTIIPSTKFTQDIWTLLIADRRYERDYAFAVPKGAKVRSSCIMIFESLTTDPGTVQFDPHCRTKSRVPHPSRFLRRVGFLLSAGATDYREHRIVLNEVSWPLARVHSLRYISVSDRLTQLGRPGAAQPHGNPSDPAREINLAESSHPAQVRAANVYH